MYMEFKFLEIMWRRIGKGVIEVVVVEEIGGEYMEGMIGE